MSDCPDCGEGNELKGKRGIISYVDDEGINVTVYQNYCPNCKKLQATEEKIN